MGLPAQNPAPQISAIAGQTVFPFSWRCDDASQVVVWKNDVQIGGSGVVLNADQTASPGGNVTLAVAAAAGDIVTIERVNPQTQNAAFSAYLPFTAVALTAALDRIVEMLQELWARFGRAITVKRSRLTKTSSFELPVPETTGLALGWKTDDGTNWYIGNLTPSASVVTAASAGTLVKNEVPAGAVNSTTGSDGNAVFTLAFAPLSAALFDLLIDGVRQPPSRYVRVGVTVTMNPTFLPIAGSDIRADYYR